MYSDRHFFWKKEKKRKENQKQPSIASIRSDVEPRQIFIAWSAGDYQREIEEMKECRKLWTASFGETVRAFKRDILSNVSINARRAMNDLYTGKAQIFQYL